MGMKVTFSFMLKCNTGNTLNLKYRPKVIVISILKCHKFILFPTLPILSHLQLLKNANNAKNAIFFYMKIAFNSDSWRDIMPSLDCLKTMELIKNKGGKLQLKLCISTPPPLLFSAISQIMFSDFLQPWVSCLTLGKVLPIHPWLPNYCRAKLSNIDKITLI